MGNLTIVHLREVRLFPICVFFSCHNIQLGILTTWIWSRRIHIGDPNNFFFSLSVLLDENWLASPKRDKLTGVSRALIRRSQPIILANRATGRVYLILNTCHDDFFFLPRCLIEAANCR